jgi:type 1 fimbria pilin
MKIAQGASSHLASWNAFSADSVNVSVTGNIVASPCIFNGGNAAGY